MVSSKCLQEINRLRQTYRPDLPQYTIPREPQPQKRKQKQRQKVDGIGSQTNQCFRLFFFGFDAFGTVFLNMSIFLAVVALWTSTSELSLGHHCLFH